MPNTIVSTDDLAAHVGDSHVGDSHVGDSHVVDSHVVDSHVVDSHAGNSRAGDSTASDSEASGSEAGSPPWAVVDCRFDLANVNWGAEQYALGHIPGAVYAHLDGDLSAEKTGRNGRHPLPSVAAMTATFSRWGIGPGVQVVCYDQDTGMYAARLWWMLRYLGHTAVAVLDGGLAKWTREGRALSAGVESRSGATFAATPQASMLLTVDQAAAPGVHLVDARAPERFEGRTEPIDRVAGHIPGARNYFFKQNLADDLTMLPPERIRQQLAPVLGATPPEETTMYCGSGVTACQNILAMEHAGLPGARLYVGSWSEWSADPARPVEQGPERTTASR